MFKYLKAKSKKRGFTLIELLVVITIIGVLSSVIFIAVNKAKMRSRDSTRLLHISQIQMALEIYRFRNGQYPNSDMKGCGGWDTSGPGGSETTGTFLTALVDGGYIPQHFQDPTTNTNCGNYKYYRYTPSYGCTDTFYVLGVVNMETSGNPYPKSPGWSCPTRNWQSEMEWVIGGFE